MQMKCFEERMKSDKFENICQNLTAIFSCLKTLTVASTHTRFRGCRWPIVEKRKTKTNATTHRLNTKATSEKYYVGFCVFFFIESCM